MTSLHVTPIDAGMVEQLLRWEAMDWAQFDSQDEDWIREASLTITSAASGTYEQFSDALENLAWGTSSDSTVGRMERALHGDVQAIESATASNISISALLRTVTERAAGADIAEIATPNGLRLRAEHTGEAYQTAVLVEDTPGRSDLLSTGTIVAASAAQALRAAAGREHAAHGLDGTDLRQIDQQLARLQQLLGGFPERATTSPYEGNADTYDLVRQQRQSDRDVAAGHYHGLSDAMSSVTPTAAGANHMQVAAPPLDVKAIREAAARLEVASTVSGRDLQNDPAVVTLAETLKRAAAAGWDLAAELPAVISQSPLDQRHPAQDLAYRVMDACPGAVPPTPSAAQLNGIEATSSGRQPEAAERAIRPSPAPDRGPAVGR